LTRLQRLWRCYKQRYCFTTCLTNCIPPALVTLTTYTPFE
jgi:hypothetical protein